MQIDMGSTKLDKTLEQRVTKLEKAVYQGLKISADVEICPRCNAMAMNAWQKGVCRNCAFTKPSSI